MIELYNSLKENNNDEIEKIKEFFTRSDLKAHRNPNVPDLGRCLKFA